jgi:tRNA (mo5U34)-methyltransferase
MIKGYLNIIQPYLHTPSTTRDYRWLQEAASFSDNLVNQSVHGHLQEYQEILEQIWSLQTKNNDSFTYTSTDGALCLPWFDHIQLGTPEAQTLFNLLAQLKPWRKGPWKFGPVEIETEWRSDWKWDRVSQALTTQSCKGKRVLDVGCGSGYHLWRIHQAGAELALGVEPFLLSIAQFYAAYPSLTGTEIQTLEDSQLPPLVLPLTLEQCPTYSWFHLVFSMGVLSHRRSPFDHLADLKAQIEPGGQLILENLVIDGKAGEVLVPRGRYAKMRNVWFIPSTLELQGWLEKAGFNRPEIVDISTTSTDEQKRTPWMEFESLEDYLDPTDKTKTIEGHPRPMRAVLTAWAPE